ncbi:MAG: hypothetical protein Q4D04_01555, partial [Clostridia bacterium]|nr:hypothetical protein [Clostridia bacterium]
GNTDSALALCREFIDAGNAREICLYTDGDYEPSGNIKVVDVKDDDEWNVAITHIEAEGTIYGTRLTADVSGYGRDAFVTFDVYVDGEIADEERLEISVNGEVCEDGKANCTNGEITRIHILIRQLYEYSNITISADADDGLPEDNIYRIYRAPEKTIDVLLMGDKTFFLERALSAFSTVGLTSCLTSSDEALEGHDIYVFDGYLPQQMPLDGAVWLINPPVAPKGVALVFGDELRGTFIKPVREFSDADLGILTRNLTLNDASVVRFREIVANGPFTPVLRCGRLPVMLAGRTDSGTAQLILAFDIQNSNLPLLTDYIILIDNMLDYCAPPMLEKQDYYCGTLVCPRTLPLCEKLFLQSPDISIRTLRHGVDEEEFMISQPGGYTLMQELSNGKEKILDFFAHIPPLESASDIANEPETIPLDIEWPDWRDESMNQSTKRFFQPVKYIAAMLLLFVILEWVVYHREKY